MRILDLFKRHKNISRKNDYAIAAMLHYCKKGKPISEHPSQYPKYLGEKFGIEDPISLQNQLIQEGYLVQNDITVALKKLKVSDLRKILADNNLQEEGKKEDLIQRIISETNPNNLNIEKTFIPSEKGIAHLNTYEVVTRLSGYNIAMEDYCKQAKASKMRPKDIVWQILNRRFVDYSEFKKYGLARNEQLYMAKLLIDEGGYAEALYRLIVVLYYDTSGKDNGCRMPLESIQVFPGLLAMIKRYRDFFTEDMAARCCQEYKLNGHYLTNKNFAVFTTKAIEGATAKELEAFVKNNARQSAKKKLKTSDNEEYEAWLNFLGAGGTSKEWEQYGKAEWEKTRNNFN